MNARRTMLCRLLNVTASAAALYGAAAGALAQPHEYALFDLGNLGEVGSAALGINGIGAVTGISETAGPGYHAYLWEAPGPMQDLGALPGGDGYSFGQGINNLGWVVGSSGFVVGHPTLWRDGEIIELTGDIPGTSGDAFDVNDGGQVVGNWVEDIGGGDQVLTGFIWEDGVMTALEKPYGPDLYTRAHAINEAGHVAGSASHPDAFAQGFLWIDGNPMYLEWNDPDGLWMAEDLNDLDQVVGYGSEGGDRHAWFWSDGVMKDIHHFGRNSYAYGINNFAEVVGFATLSGTLFDWAAFHWSEATGMRDLNQLMPPRNRYIFTEAYDINDAGQIVGSARKNGFPVPNWSLLLTPVHTSMTLEAYNGRLISGQRNALTVTGATPGNRVYFAYSETGGGSYIPGCTLQENALQLQDPKTLGSAVADADGVARLQRYIPRPALGRTLLLQAVVPGECAVSELIVETIE